MKTEFLKSKAAAVSILLLPICGCALTHLAAKSRTKAPEVPRFSLSYMDRSLSPRQDFYKFAAGNWLKTNPVPSDKTMWGAFDELAERNYYQIHEILDSASLKSETRYPQKMVGDFFASATNTNLIEQLRFKPIEADLKRIDHIASLNDLFTLLADFHQQGIDAIFDVGFDADEKNSSIYALHFWQGGIALPDRDYYLKEPFADLLKQYRAHVIRMFTLLGETTADAERHAAIVLDIETALAKAGRSRVDLRDPDKNYHKLTTTEFLAPHATLRPQLLIYLSQTGFETPVDGSRTNRTGLIPLPYEIVGQPEFFAALDPLVREHSLDDWKTYLRWHVLHSSARYLHREVDLENFAFFGTALSGQQEQEPRWKRAARVIDRSVGEALGQLYVEKYFPPEASIRMKELVNNLKVAFREHLEKVDWMSGATRAKALVKFDRFTQKIGFPEKYRDYSSVVIRRDDYLGNVRRATEFEYHRQLVRVGQPVDRTEWQMTPETVNAYFEPVLNEIVFPAGILQPPFFDATMDDAVNYGAIGAVIGHEITHGYDDEGRKYDADGNLNEWWTEDDAKSFDARAKKIVDEFNAFEALPGLRVNGELTLGENIADLGGVTIAYDALQTALAKDPSKRKTIGGYTPEQRFFISFAQLWRWNITDAQQRQLATTDPHSPGPFRAVGPLMNFQPFYDAFNIAPGDAMFRPENQRAKIW